MSYERPLTEHYGEELGNHAFSGAATLKVKGPKGCVGFVRDIYVDVTTSIVGTTTVPEIGVGISSGDYSYGRYRLGTAIVTGYNTGSRRASQEAWTGNPPRTLSDFVGHVALETARIPADTEISVFVVAAVGAAAGNGRIRVQIDWIGQPIA